MTLGQLRRVRWAVRLTLTFGVAASVAANILHANPNPISQTIAGWPPLALLFTVELVSRVPVHRRALAVPTSLTGRVAPPTKPGGPAAPSGPSGSGSSSAAKAGTATTNPCPHAKPTRNRSG